MEGMKEYLVKQPDGKYAFDTAPLLPWDEEFAIEIPEGAEVARKFMGGQIEFFKNNDKLYFNYAKKKWKKTLVLGAPIIWQRAEKPLEYLDPSDWSLKLVDREHGAAQEAWILVPDGAELAVKSRSFTVRFYKINGENLETFDHDSDKWITSFYREATDVPDIIWQRHTQPEELPFVDDEPKATIFKTTAVGKSEPILGAGYYIRPKPRVRAYATLVHKIDIDIVIKPEPQYISLGFVIDTDAISKAAKKAGKALSDAVIQMNEALKLNRLG